VFTHEVILGAITFTTQQAEHEVAFQQVQCWTDPAVEQWRTLQVRITADLGRNVVVILVIWLGETHVCLLALVTKHDSTAIGLGGYRQTAS